MVIDHITDEGGFAPYVGIRFTTSYRGERNGVNPQTGEPITIAATHCPKVKFSKSIKDAVNEAMSL